MAEGLALVFVGPITLIVAMSTAPGDTTALLVFRLCAAALCVLATRTVIAGFQRSVLPIRMSPVVSFTAVALILVRNDGLDQVNAGPAGGRLALP